MLFNCARLDERGDVRTPDVDLSHVLEDDEREPAHELFGNSASNTELRLDPLRVEQFGERLAHVPNRSRSSPREAVPKSSSRASSP